MAILKYNDGNTFADAEKAPLPQSEGEIGFRDEKSGVLILRYDELAKLQKHFNSLYINQLQIQGRLMEQQKQQKIAEKMQKNIEDANPKLTQKSNEYAAKYRAKQLAVAENQNSLEV